MTLTPSTMLELGTPMPPFELPDTVSGTRLSSQQLRDAHAIVVAFICNHCPYVKHVRSGLAQLGHHCQAVGAKMVAISSNDVASHPSDSPARMALEAQDAGYPFPYLYDEDQRVARDFHATCTPDFFVFDREGLLAYRGQLDDSRPGNGIPVTGSDVRAAVDALVAGHLPQQAQKPSVGCNIKWKPGVEPGY